MACEENKRKRLIVQYDWNDCDMFEWDVHIIR